MLNRHRLPARIAPLVGSMLASFGIAAGCSDTEGARFSDESFALCGKDAGDCDPEAASTDEATLEEEAIDGEAPVAEDEGWLDRCTSDAECGVGSCVCGLCTAPCSDDAPACPGVPAEAACYGSDTSARAALCHASTTAGICLLPCTSNDDCGEGFVCALDACLPKPPAR